MKVVYLEWLDSVSDPGWTHTKVTEDLLIRSVGFIIEENPASITIATSVYGKTQHSPLTIPKIAIKKRRKVAL